MPFTQFQRLAPTCVLLFASLTSLAGSAHAQAPTNQIAFEVTSVKPSAPGGRHGVYTDGSPRQILMLGMTLKQLMTFAFEVESYRIVASGLPTESYDVIARIPEEAVKLHEDVRWNRIHSMTQSKLAERFKLAVHRCSAEIPAYRLTLAKGESKIHELGPNPGDNVLVNRRPGHVSAQQMPMSQLAQILRGELKRPVVDETGVKGVFDVTLDWVPDLTDGADALPSAGGPSLLTAVEEQLGLKLVWGKSTLEVIYVDYAEKASEN